MKQPGHCEAIQQQYLIRQHRQSAIGAFPQRPGMALTEMSSNLTFGEDPWRDGVAGQGKVFHPLAKQATTE